MPLACASARAACIWISRSPWSTASQERLIAAQQGLVLDLEVLGHGHEHLLDAGALERVVEVEDVL